MKKIIYFLPAVMLAQNITQINYKGLIHISPVSANAIIKITPESEFNIQKIDKSIKALYKTGYFRNIKADFKDGKLTFICLEKPTITTIKTENLSDEVKKVLKEQNLMPKKGEILNLEKLKRLKQFIQNYYLAKGYFNTVVETKATPLTKTRVILNIAINKGKNVVIRNVNFYGSTLPKSDLIDEIENQPRDFWSFLPFFNSGHLKLYKLIEDKTNLQNYYLNLGYMDAKVSLPFAKTNLDSYFADIDYKIHQGQRYIVKKVSIEYPKNIKVKLPEFNLKASKYFNVSALRKDIKDIKHAFQNVGYAYARVYPEIQKKGHFAIIKYNVIPGEIVYIRNVTISGNTKTLDRVIRRSVYLAPGDKYSYQNIVDTKYSLQRSGYIKNVKIKEKKVSSNQIDLFVKVTEGLSGSLRAGISYGSYTKLGFNINLTEKDVFGSGQSVSFNADINSKSSNYSISLVNPRVFDSKYSFNASVFNTSFEGISYDSKERGFTLGVGRELTRNLKANITYGYTRNELSDYSTTVDVKPNSTKSYIVPSLSFNNTDNYLFPTKGQKASVSAEYAGIGGDEKYLKILGKYQYFYPITNKTYKTIAVLKLRAKGGYIQQIGYLPINEKFYLGGMNTVRGFNYYSISPKDSQGNLIGGKREFITGPEISTPLSQKSHLWISGFIDYGAIGENNLNITRSSYGVELNWITPMGPLSFIWAWPLKSEKDDDLQKFEFNLGTAF